MTRYVGLLLVGALAVLGVHGGAYHVVMALYHVLRVALG